MTAGQRLADARHHLGFSLEALESRTGFGAELLRSIEETDLLHLPSGALLEAAVRAFAAAVQLDAEAFSKRYLASLPILANTAEALTAFEPEADEQALQPASGLFAYEPAYDSRVSQLAAPRPASRTPIGVLLLVSAIAVLAGYVLSAQSQWWKRPSQPDPNLAHAVKPDKTPSLPAPATALPAPATDSVEAGIAARSDSTPSPAPLESREGPGAKADPRPTTPADSHPAIAADSAVPSAFVVVPGSEPTTASVPSATTAPETRGELSGSWNVVAHDEGANGEVATNRVAYYVRLEHRGTQIVGSGYRVSEDRAEAASSQQPVSVRGTLSGERLTLNFSGRDRERFVLYRSDDGVFRGRFRRDGAPADRSSVITVSPRDGPR